MVAAGDCSSRVSCPSSSPIFTVAAEAAWFAQRNSMRDLYGAAASNNSSSVQRFRPPPRPPPEALLTTSYPRSRSLWIKSLSRPAAAIFGIGDV